MFKSLQTLGLGLLIVFAPAFAATAGAANQLELIHYGWMEIEENGKSEFVKEFRLGYGNTEQQDQTANTPFRTTMGPFGLNAALYFRNPDGSWNHFNFRLPADAGVAPVDSQEHDAFVAFMKRDDVRLLLEKPYEKTDFGTPTDFIYKKMNLPASALPAPFNHFPPQVLEKLDMVMQYNADKTAKAYFRQPHDREASATELFKQIKDRLPIQVTGTAN